MAALLGNMENAVKMVETAENAVGSASRENEKYLDSLQGRIDVMQGSFQALSNVVIDSSFLKGGVSAIDAIIKSITILIENLGLLPTALGAVATGFALFGKKAVSFDSATKSVKLFGKEIANIRKNVDSESTGKGSLFDFGLNHFESELDKKKQQIDKDVEALKKYQEIQTDINMPDYQKKTQSDVQLAKMSENAREYATSINAASINTDGFAASEMELAVQAELTSKSLRSQLTLLKEYNSAQKKGVGSRTGKTTKDISAQLVGTELGSTAVGSIIAGAKGGEVKISKALGGIVKGAAKTALKGIAETVASAFTGILGGIAAGFAIDALFAGAEWFFDNVINRAQHAAEAVSEMNEKFNETKSTLNNSKQVVSDYSDQYSKLSQGINLKTNENINLSSEEYSQYLDTVNQIAQTFPELVSGYDAQGNAILNCAGNVNALNEAYNSQAIDEYNKVLKDSATAMEDFNNKKKEIENGSGDNLIDKKQYEALKDAMGNDKGKSIKESLDGLNDYLSIANALQKAGADEKGFFEVNKDYVERIAKEQPEIVRQVISGFEDSMASASEGMQTIAEAYIGKAFAEGDYSNISDSMQTVLTNAISGLDYDFFSQFDTDKDMEAELDNILSAFNSLDDSGKKQLEMSFDLQTKLNNGDISVSEYLSSIKDVGSIIDGMDINEDTKKALRLQFDIDDNYIQEQYDNLTKELTKNGFAENEVESWLGSLSGTDLSIAATLDLEGKDSIQDLQEALDLAKALQGVGSIDIAVETEGFEKLNTAITESNGAIGLSQDSIDAISNRYANLEGFDPAAIFEKTTTGVRLNTQALNSMENQLIATNKAANAKNLSVLAKRAKELEESISAANAAGEDTSGFEAQLETVRESIQDAQMAAAAYDGLTSAYKGWVDAQSAGQQGDMYDNILAGMESAQELAKSNKWGNTELQEFIKMFSAEGSMDTATPQQFADAWGSAISKAQRYFAEGTKGVDNFFADIQDKNAELLTETDGKLNFAPNVEVEDVAEALGVAESTVEAIVGMANEYGANIKIGVEQQSLDELVASSEQAAQEASNALKSTLGEDFEISYDLKVNEDGTTNATAELEKLKAKRDEINNSDATVEVKEQGVDAVNAQIESLIREKIQLEQPAFMSLDTSQVSASMVDALGKVQEMQKALDNLSALNQMQEYNISVNASDIDAAQQKVDECATTIQELPSEVKVAIGIDQDASIEDIKKSFESGSVSIGVDTSATSNIDKAKETLDTIKDKDVTLTIKVDGDADKFEKAAEASKELDGVKSNYVSMTAKLDTNLDGQDDQVKNLDKFAKAAKKLDGVSSNTVRLNAYLDSDIWGDDKVAQLDNLSKFAKSVKELQGVDGNTTVSLNAYLDSNLWGDDKVQQLNNIDKFFDAANKLKDISGETEVRLNAYLDSNLWGDDKVQQLQNIDKFAEAANKLKNAGGNIETNVKAYFDSNLWGDDKTAQLSNMEDFAKAAQDLQDIGNSEVNLKAYFDSNLWGDDKNAQLSNIDAFSEAAKTLNGIGNIEVNLKAYLDSNLWGDDKTSQLSNIDKFADAASRLNGISGTEVSLKAYLDSNLWGGDKEAQLQNIDSFTDAATKLQGVSSSTVSLKAYLDSNLWGDDKVQQIGNLDAFSNAAAKLNGISDVNVSVTANIGNVPDQATTDRLVSFASVVNQLQGISNVNITVTANADTSAINNVKNALQSLSDSGVMKSYTANVKVNVDTSAIASLQAAISGVQTKAVAVTASVAGTPAVTALQTAIANVTAKTVGVTANVTGTTETNALINAINGVNSKLVSVTASVSGTSSVNALANAIAAVRSKTVTVTTRQRTVSEANGTAHVDGTANTGKAFKQGKWGAKESGTALMGELGPELIVRGDKFFTVGDNGAGFYQYKKGDIIFNHRQTEELLKNGYVTSNGGRGRAFLEGTAFASLAGGWTPGGIKPSGSGTTVVNNNTTNNYYGSSSSSKKSSSSSSSKSTKSSSSKSSSTKEADDFEETLDWIEIAIDRIERALDNLDKVASSTYRSWSERNAALNESMAVTRQEIDMQQQAYDRYMQQAQSVGLSSDWQNKVMNGSIDIEVITDEDLKDKIDEFQEFYDKALDAKDAVIDLTEALGDLAMQRFENVQAQFDGILGSLEYEQSMVENFIDRAEVDGQFVSKNYYKFLQDNVHAQAEALRQQVKEMIAARDAAVNEGTMQVGDEAWDKMNNDINDVTVSIHELGTQWAEYNKAIRETEWEIFDTIQDRISNINTEAQFLIDLMSNDKLFEDNGQFTDKGLATMGLYAQQYNVLMNQADRYAEEIKKLEEQMGKEEWGTDYYGNATNAFNQDIIDRYYELIEAQQEAILSAEDMKESIKDLVSEGIDLELEHLDDLINKYLDALHAQED